MAKGQTEQTVEQTESTEPKYIQLRRQTIANAHVMIAKAEKDIREYHIRQSNPDLLSSMRGFRSRFALMGDEALAARAADHYGIEADGMERDVLIKAMVDAEFADDIKAALG